MKNFPKPNVVASKCLGFAKCRYNGNMIPNHFVNSLKKHVNFIPVCPEVEIGLGIPRKPIRIIKKSYGNVLLQPATGKDFSCKMKQFTEKFLSNLHHVDGFILKYKSPSCGKNNVNI